LDLVSELANVVRALDAAGVPYALCGGIAVTIHGHVRATKDIDLLILPEDRTRALASVAHRTSPTSSASPGSLMAREPVDMSPPALARRLAELRALVLLAQSLRKARRIGPSSTAPRAPRTAR
jgi:hypothetical protein